MFRPEIHESKLVTDHTEPLGSNQDYTITGSTNIFDY